MIICPGVFKLVSQFNSKNASPEKSTGWYLPSIGEWIDIWGAIGGIDIASAVKTGTVGTYSTAADEGAEALENINAYLEKAGSDVDKFEANNSSWWASTEYTISSSYYVQIVENSQIFFGRAGGKGNTCNVRCISPSDSRTG